MSSTCDLKYCTVLSWRYTTAFSWRGTIFHRIALLRRLVKRRRDGREDAITKRSARDKITLQQLAKEIR